ncbi:MAG TPA: trimethyllysine dioxygenase [Steroidobacteraceae bacterium]|nr:trimethyllysine dioxygenase [Steroidobacteraceae bacterium]
MSACLEEVTVRDGAAVLTFRAARPAVTLSFIWLRDHCPCAQCLHPETRQRLSDTLAIAPDIGPRAMSLQEDGRILALEWPDGHASRFDARFLANLARDPQRLPVARELWDAAQLLRHPPEVSYESFMASDAVLLEALESLERCGLCWVEGVPGTPEATIAAAERIAYIRVTIFGGYYDFTGNLEHKDTAYTSLAIGPHTDGTYSFDAPGYQMFHCLAAQCTGGDSAFIDGFKIAAIMREHHPQDYDVLTSIAIPGQYRDHDRGVHLAAARPLFRLNERGELTQVSYNNHDRAPFLLPLEESRRFYRALGIFARLAADPMLQYRRRLLPGSVVFFDNWRLLHARDAYSGYRRLAGAYHNKEDIESRLRVLRRGANAANAA